MSTRRIKILSWVFGIASVLLIYYQIKWILSSYETQKVIFRENMIQIMNQSVTDLEQKKFLHFFFRDTLNFDIQVDKEIKGHDSTRFHFSYNKQSENTMIARDSFEIMYDSLKGRFWIQQVRSYVEDYLHSANKHKFTVDSEEVSIGVIAFNEDLILDTTINTKVKKSNKLNKKMLKFPGIDSNRFYKKDYLYLLDSILTRNLRKQGLKPDYKFAVLRNKHLLKITDIENYSDKINRDSALKVRLNSKDLLLYKEYLLLEVFNVDEIAVKSMLIPSITTLLLIVIIVFTAYISITTNFRQKKISEIKNDFINNMTHELKTPISTISLAAEALANKYQKAEKVKHYSEIIFYENKRLGDQVEKILQLARIEKGEIQLNITNFNLNELISNLLDSFKLQFQQKIVNVTRELTSDPVFVDGDKIHIYNSLYNIIENSFKYSEKNLSIKVKTSIQNDLVMLEISDNGIGMTEEVKNRIFEKFYRAPTGNIHNVKGYGIGLSYVHAILNLHGASIVVESWLNKGTTFKIYFKSEVGHV